MDLIVVGVNHRKAPVEVRERLAFPHGRLAPAVQRLRACPGVAETVILSTCNRVEVYAVSNGIAIQGEQLRRFLAGESGVPDEHLREAAYEHCGPTAVRHLFRVAASLDSMIIGETQILGQVRDAYVTAKEAGATGRLCNTLFQRALAVGKAIRTHTHLSQHNVSVASVAVEFVLKVFQDLAHRTVMILGAGETGTETVSRLKDAGIARVVVCNRTLEAAQELAREVEGQAVPLESLEDYLQIADVVITCASAPKPLLEAVAVRRAMAARDNRPMFLMDIAVPRNVEPETNSIENVYLYNIDDLQEVVLRNLDIRRREIPTCEAIIEREVGEYMNAMRLLDVSPALQAVQDALLTLGRAELARTLEGMRELDPREREALDKMVHRLVDRILTQPITVLKEELRGESGVAMLEAFKRLFRVS